MPDKRTRKPKPQPEEIIGVLQRALIAIVQAYAVMRPVVDRLARSRKQKKKGRNEKPVKDAP